MANQNQNLNPAPIPGGVAMPQSGNELGATDVTQTFAKNTLGIMASLMANAHMLEAQGNPQNMGRMVQGTMPAIPTPSVMPSAVPNPQMSQQWGMTPPVPASPQTGAMGQGASFMDRKRQAQTDIINMTKNAVNSVVNHRKEQEVQQTVHDFQIFTTAMQALKANPDDKQNERIVNDMLDPKKNPKFVSRMEKIFGEDMQDVKSQQKLMSDPHYQAVMKVANEVPNVGLDGQPIGGTVGETMQPGQQQVGQQQPAGQEWRQNLNPAAQAFLNKYPNVPHSEFIPNPYSKFLEYAIEHKILPQGDVIAKAIPESIRGVAQALGDVVGWDKAKLQASVDTWGKYMDYQKAIKIASLESYDKALDRGIKERELTLKGKENDMTLQMQVYTMHKTRVDILHSTVEQLQGELQNGLTSGKLKGQDRKDLEKMIAQKRDDLAVASQGLDKIATDTLNRAGMHGVPTTPNSGTGAAANVESIVGGSKPGAAKSGPASNGSGTTNAPANGGNGASATQQSGVPLSLWDVNPIAAAARRNPAIIQRGKEAILPWFGGDTPQ